MSDLIQQYHEILAAVGAVVVAVELLVRTLQAVAGTLRKLSTLTASKVDDEAAGKLSTALDRIAAGLHWFERKVPRASLGKKA